MLFFYILLILEITFLYVWAFYDSLIITDCPYGAIKLFSDTSRAITAALAKPLLVGKTVMLL